MSASPSTPSTIRVFVQWKEQTIFAGEDIECEITFKNVAVSPSPSRSSPQPSAVNNLLSPGPRKAAQIKNSSPLNPRPGPPRKGHRSTLSLNVPAGSLLPQPVPSPWSARHAPKSSGESGQQHRRSVSIISIGASGSVVEDTASQSSFPEIPRGPARGHARSASLHIVPRGLGINGSPTTALAQRSMTQPSPLFSFPSNTSERARPGRPRRQTGGSTTPNTPNLPTSPFTRRNGSGTIPQVFRFPAISVPNPDAPPAGYFNGGDGNQDSSLRDKLLSPRSRDSLQMGLQKTASGTRILSPASAAGTPRSSGEFYSLSNNSTDTLASEYIPQPIGRGTQGGHIRRSSNLSPVNNHRPPEALMMGYAQIHGSFTLDGSLISQTPFEEVKRKGVVGGQGGGVIGVETSKRDSGLLRGFGWGGLGESLGGLLGGGELSSMKEMRGIASSRSIPLLSTPQSILFVDLRLAPGESRSYEYSFKLPRGLPPSHRGKAIKITYKLVIGTQRPGGSKEQQVKSVEVPFRVLGSVNSHGELLGHDLMSPYIILRDQARVRTVESDSPGALETLQEVKPKDLKKLNDSTSENFLTYINELLTTPRRTSSFGLLSPTEGPRSRRQSLIEEPATVKEAVDMAILRSNVATEMQQSANRFEIARSGKRVAVVMLARPAYRLGESISAVVDFTDAEIPCYAVHMALETSEKVDSSIALRSEASILRVTRKVHVSHSESTLFSRRVVFSPTIPIGATPEFITSGVSLDWRIRIEFVTPPLFGERNEASPKQTELLEEISRDERGAVFASAETVQCESFEIAVPLRVYGATANAEKEEGSADGLIV